MKRTFYSTLALVVFFGAMWAFNAWSVQPIDTGFVTEPASFVYQDALNNLWSVSDKGVKIGRGATGTVLSNVEFKDLDFSSTTSQTATVGAIETGHYYYVTIAWKTCDTAPGNTTVAVSGSTLTVTTANSVTGECSVGIFQRPY